MGNPKQKWTAEEEEALRAGVAKHGTGKWKNIQKDPEFNHHLYTRSNIDLKDKWRNMSVSAGGQGPRDKSRITKPKSDSDAPDGSFTLGAPATPLLLTYTPPASSTPPVSSTPPAPSNPSNTPASSIQPASSTLASHDAVPLAAVPTNDSTKWSLDVKTASKYDNMIYDALKNLNDPNGSDATAIVRFIEQKQEVPQNFRRLLVSRLRRLVVQEKIEKVHNCYKTKNDAVPGTKAPTPTPKPKEIRPRQPQPTPYLPDTVLDAAKNAAYKIAVADNKESVAAEAGKEADRINKMAEDAETLLKIAQDIFDRCSRGEIVTVS